MIEKLFFAYVPLVMLIWALEFMIIIRFAK